MNLIFLYGPPAVGKLTVANELEKLIGYKNFHGHRSLDAISDIFEFGTKAPVEIIENFRASVLEKAAEERLSGLIFTYVYFANDPWIQDVVKMVERHDGRVCFVQLTAPKDVLMERLASPSRTGYSKLKDLEKFKDMMRRYNLTSSVSQPNNLVIDTSITDPQDAAQKIAEHFEL